jgi:hypothetical protein
MSATEKKDQFRLGFLTAMEVPEQGFVGGLLITNRHGRPLEFQCTAPLKPNRTQEILYGSTLGPYVMGEVIARTLVEKVGVKPHLILTERTEILELRNHVAMPIGCLDADQSEKVPSATESGFKIGRQWFRVHSGHNADRGELETQTTQVPKDADMREPFERVREALLETVKSGK